MDLEYQKACNKYSVRYMSNSKWFKLFAAWADAGIEVEVSYWRFIDSEHEEVHCLPKSYDLLPHGFADGRFQPFEYKWILSVAIPQNYRPKSNVAFERSQDVEHLKSIAKELGHFPIFDLENGIEVRGYEE